MAQKLAAGLVTEWEARFIDTMRQATWLAEVPLYAKLGEQFYRLHGFNATETETPLHPADLSDNAIFSSDTLLWPLALYGLPQTQSGAFAECPATQVFSRWSEISLQYVPLGSDEVSVSEAGDTALSRFNVLFREPVNTTNEQADFRVREKRTLPFFRSPNWAIT